MNDQEIQEKLRKILDSEVGNGVKMVRIIRSIASLPKDPLRDDILKAIGWLNQDVDQLFFRTTGELAREASQRSEFMLELLVMEAEAIEQRLAFVEEMLPQQGA